MWPWLTAVAKWCVKFTGGFLPIGTKPVPEWAGKILWVVGIIIIYNFVVGLIHKPQSNTSQMKIVALPFSHVGNIDMSSSQKAETPKRKWWMPIPYVSGAGVAEQFSGGETKTGAKVEAGLRIDF